MKHFEWTWYTADKTRLYAQSWQPDGAAVGVVCLVHGLGEHSSRYAHVAAALGAAGYVTLTFDQRGHGKSQGARGDAASYDEQMDDIKRLLAEAGERYPVLPRFLYGHSTGRQPGAQLCAASAHPAAGGDRHRPMAARGVRSAGLARAVRPSAA